MDNLTSFDWWVATYLLAAGMAPAFYVGQLFVKLLLVRFASHKRIDDVLWRLGTLLEMRYGELKENEMITVQAKRFTFSLCRTSSHKMEMFKKESIEQINNR